MVWRTWIEGAFGRALGLVLGLASGVIVGSGACGPDPSPSLPAEALAEAEAPAEAMPVGTSELAPERGTVLGDPLLTRARQQIRGGRLPAAVEAEVLGSTAPVHARARRILAAMARPPGDEVEAAPAAVDDEDGDEDEDARRLPSLVPPSESVPPTPTTARGSPGSSSRPTGSRTKPGAPVPKAPRGEVRVGGLALRSSTRGATLTIAAPSSLVVGVVHQRDSGIVRLVIESARAGGSLLSARPRVEGAQVTAVRQGQGTVQVTVRLDPGWTLGSVKPFSGGARVHLRAPP